MVGQNNTGPQVPSEVKTGTVVNRQPLAENGNNNALAIHAEIDCQIATAKMYPRNIVKAEAGMKAMVCKSTEVAGECFYVLPRGENSIEGPSIRMAEIIAINYGNMRVVTRLPIIGAKEVSVEWAAHDLESNYATTGTVSTCITKSNGQRYNNDMVNTTCLATTAKARRNGIIAITPGTLVNELMQTAREFSVGGDRPIESLRDVAMNHFRKLGLRDDRILATYKKTSVAQLTKEDLVKMRGLATAIKDGHTTIDSAFPALSPEAPEPKDVVAGKVGEAAVDKQAQQSTESMPPPASNPAPASNSNKLF